MSDAISGMLGRLPSGLFIFTARSADGQETGMLTSWVQQAGFEPPAITVAVNSKRYLRDWLTVGAIAGLSQLGETQKSLLGKFGKGFEPGEPAFDGVETETSPSGLTMLKDALGWIEGPVTGILESGDHAIVLMEITSASLGPRHAEERPWVHLRKNGLKY